MFEASNQFYYFAEGLFYGVLCGMVYEIFVLPARLFENRLVKFFCDLLFFAVCSVGYFFASSIFAFPSFRLYQPLSVFLGMGLWGINLHKTVAKITSPLYNKYRRRKLRRKSDDRIKNEKIGRRRFFHGGDDRRRARRDMGDTTCRYGRKEGGSRKA
ncbi:MAG: spore cortex biosynthesis protein YabQ [Clostridia bacterium]|nr:spore cortex biosynthesis protein YabQ [Clostridia bacterium]